MSQAVVVNANDMGVDFASDSDFHLVPDDVDVAELAMEDVDALIESATLTVSVDAMAEVYMVAVRLLKAEYSDLGPKGRYGDKFSNLMHELRAAYGGTDKALLTGG